jgi:transcription initiation factor TFIID subunit 10
MSAEELKYDKLEGSKGAEQKNISNNERISGVVEKKYLWSEDLSDFLSALDDYAPTVPEATVQYYMQKGGVDVADPRIVKVIALATDKFLAETIHDAKQIGDLRNQSSKANEKRKWETQPCLEMVRMKKYVCHLSSV